jgi:hypothetical protein
MYRFLASVGATASLLFLSNAVLADGYGTPSGYERPFSWTGFYIGANVGWERKHMVGSDYTIPGAGPTIVDLGFNSFSNNLTDGTSTAAPTSQNLQGWIGGGQIGYNYQFGRAVIGTELSASWNDVSGSGDCFGIHGTRLDPTDGGLERVTADSDEDQYSGVGHQLSHTYLADGALAHPCSSQTFTLSRVVVLKS